MNEWLAHSILVDSFADLALGPIAYEQREFTPPADGSVYYAVSVVPAERVPVTLGDDGDDRYAGIMQIDVSTQQGKGVRTAIDAARVITAFYTAGRALVRGTDYVRVQRSEISPARRDGVRLLVSVSVFWETRIPRKES